MSFNSPPSTFGGQSAVVTQQKKLLFQGLPPLAPPDMPLPPLPNSKTRLPDTPVSLDSRRESSSSQLPTPTSRSATPSTLPKLNTTGLKKKSSLPMISHTAQSPVDLPTKRVISIGAFPQPPKGNTKPSGQSPSPRPSPNLSSTSLNSLASRDAQHGNGKVRLSQSRGRRTSKNSVYGQLARAVSSPIVNDSPYHNGQEKALPRLPSLDNHLTILSPPASRPTSAHGSAVTDGTHFEDVDEMPARDKMRPNDVLSVKSVRSTKSFSKDGKGNVLVSVRVRPDGSGNDSSRISDAWTVDGRRSAITYRGREGGDFRYDNVFQQQDHNSRVYDQAAKRLVRRVMEGYHGTVFAYGMTGTGKTFSMQGTAQSPGVIPLAITDIFSYIRENPNREFLLRVSYLEIYNEKIYDLLSSSAGGIQEDIKLREDSRRGVYATPLKEEIVQSPTQLLRVIARGDVARRTSSTQYNARSSRSHAVVQIVVESRERTRPEDDQNLPSAVLVSTLSLIDLAGSERAAEDKERRTEGAHINKSLLTLGTVISRLSGDKEGGKEKILDVKHLPYRDSKLTRLLQSALSGNSLISILCTIHISTLTGAAASAHTGETLNTLNFASRAKNNIVSHAKRNESYAAHAGDAGSRALLDRYRLEIDELKQQLETQNKDKVESERTEEEEVRRRELERESVERHEEQMLEMQLARTALKERIGHLNRLILSSKSIGVNAGRLSAPLGTPEIGLALGSPLASRNSSLSVDGVPPARRTVSAGSMTFGTLPAAHMTQALLEEEGEDDEDPVSAAGSGEGQASSGQQIRALQADLSDKNRYILTLEKRLLQARHTNQSRSSLPATPILEDEPNVEQALRIKDKEIEELRARLDDQTKMVNALRSAARTSNLFSTPSPSSMLSSKRPSLGAHDTQTQAQSSDAEDRPQTALHRRVSSPVRQIRRCISPTKLTRRSTSPLRPARRTPSHRSNPSNSSTGSRNFSRLTPVALLSSQDDAADSIGKTSAATTIAQRSLRSKRSVEEMTKMIDEMIQHRVDSGTEVDGIRSRGRRSTNARHTVSSPLVAAGGDFI